MQKTLVAVLVDTAHVEHPDRIALDGAPMLTSSQLTIDRSTLEKLLRHAAFAAHLVGHLDDDKHAELIGQIGDQVDAVVHGLTELLGDPRTLAAPGLQVSMPAVLTSDYRATLNCFTERSKSSAVKKPTNSNGGCRGFWIK